MRNVFAHRVASGRRNQQLRSGSRAIPYHRPHQLAMLTCGPQAVGFCP